jgi:hypothetical protein
MTQPVKTASRNTIDPITVEVIGSALSSCDLAEHRISKAEAIAAYPQTL